MLLGRETKRNTGINLLKHTNEESIKQKAPPIVWEIGNVAQIRSLLVLREAELVVAKTHLTGDPSQDWYAHNQIINLEIKIADLKRWLAGAMEKNNGSAE